ERRTSSLPTRASGPRARSDSGSTRTRGLTGRSEGRPVRVECPATGYLHDKPRVYGQSGREMVIQSRFETSARESGPRLLPPRGVEGRRLPVVAAGAATPRPGGVRCPTG